MTMQSIDNKVIAKIKKANRGSLFFTEDFLFENDWELIQNLDAKVLKYSILRLKNKPEYFKPDGYKYYFYDTIGNVLKSLIASDPEKAGIWTSYKGGALCYPISDNQIQLFDDKFQYGSIVTIKDGYLGVKGYNWVKIFAERVAKGEAEAKKINDEVAVTILEQTKKAAGAFNVEPYIGKYTDQWFGEVEISLKEGKPWFASKRSPRLSGPLFPYKGNTLIVRWTNRSMDADAFVMFSTDKDGKPAGIKMNAISPLTDFSFDFQDLDFKRIN